MQATTIAVMPIPAVEQQRGINRVFLIQIQSNILDADTISTLTLPDLDWSQMIQIVLPEQSATAQQIMALANHQLHQRLEIAPLFSTILEKPLHTSPLARSKPITEALSKREWDVLQLIAQGLSNQRIAQTLTITMNTVKMHIKHIYQKLRVSNRTQAIARIWHFSAVA